MELQQCEVTAHSSFDLPIPLEWSSSKKSQTKKAGEIVERRQPSYTTGENLSGEATTEDSTEIPYKTKNRVTISSVQFSSVTQSCPTLCNPMNCSTSASLFITNSQSLPKLMSIESVMPSSHLILCRPLFLPPSIITSIRVFPNESVLPIR